MLSTIQSSITLFKKDRSAAGALEYALLVSFIAVAIVAGATLFGNALSTFFSGMATSVGTMGTTAAGKI